MHILAAAALTGGQSFQHFVLRHCVFSILRVCSGFELRVSINVALTLIPNPKYSMSLAAQLVLVADCKIVLHLVHRDTPHPTTPLLVSVYIGSGQRKAWDDHELPQVYAERHCFLEGGEGSLTCC